MKTVTARSYQRRIGKPRRTLPPITEADLARVRQSGLFVCPVADGLRRTLREIVKGGA